MVLNYLCHSKTTYTAMPSVVLQCRCTHQHSIIAQRSGRAMKLRHFTFEKVVFLLSLKKLWLCIFKIVNLGAVFWVSSHSFVSVLRITSNTEFTAIWLLMKRKDRMQHFGMSGDSASLKEVLMTQKLHSQSNRKVPTFSKLDGHANSSYTWKWYKIHSKKKMRIWKLVFT